MNFDYDLFVIGAGSGGTRAARMSAALGAKVAIAEELYLGGTCVNVGCIPKKLFVYGSHYAEDFKDGAAYGWTTSSETFDWPTLRDNKTREIERLNGVYRDLLEGPGAEIIRERATFANDHAVVVAGETVTAENILIATGSRASVPPFPGDDLVITSDEAFYLDTFPDRVVIIGGGYIAVEFAGIFNGLGAATTLLYRGPLFLRGFDGGVRNFVAGELRGKGVALHFDTQINSIERAGAGLVVHTDAGDALEADVVLCATGRGPNTASLGLAQAGVELGRTGGVSVDDRYRTSAPHIRAIGDVIGGVQLTPVAIAEGMCIAYNLFGGEDREMDYDGNLCLSFHDCHTNSALRVSATGPSDRRLVCREQREGPAGDGGRHRRPHGSIDASSGYLGGGSCCDPCGRGRLGAKGLGHRDSAADCIPWLDWRYDRWRHVPLLTPWASGSRAMAAALW